MNSERRSAIRDGVHNRDVEMIRRGTYDFKNHLSTVELKQSIEKEHQKEDALASFVRTKKIMESHNKRRSDQIDELEEM